MFFAGIHVQHWQSVRKVNDGPTINDLFGFLTTNSNNPVKPINEKPMLVLLLSKKETDTWMRALRGEVKKLPHPRPDETLINSPLEAYLSSILLKSGEPM